MEHNKIKLIDCCHSISDGDHLPPPKSSSGVPFITISNIDKDNHINFQETLFVSESYYDRLSDEKKAHKGDILYSVVGSFGKPVYIDYEKKFVFQRHIAILKPNSSVNSRYLYYIMCSPNFYYIADKMAIGAAQRTITLDSLRNISVNIPTLCVQNAIVEVLDCLDKKIHCNKQIIVNLQHQLKLIYDYWFTQFDFPDENGKPYRSSGGAMVWSEELQREIPKGWTAKAVSDIAVLQTKSVNPQNGITYYHYSIPSFDDTHSPTIKDGESIASNKYVVPDNCVLVSKLNPQFKRIWLVTEPYDNSVCSTEFLPIKATDAGVYALYSLLNSDAFSIHLIQNASSSTGSRKRIDPVNCMSYKFPYNRDIFARFDKTIQLLLTKISNIPAETQALVALRDWLLPMLMNGQASIVDEHEGKPQIKISRFEQWLTNQGFAARGDVDMETLRDIFEVMDDVDK